MLEPILTSQGLKMGSVDDMIAGVMRVACDESVYGRAVAIAAGENAGDRNFDLEDDFVGYDAGRETRERILDDTIGGLQNMGEENAWRIVTK